jgi:uncharacterized membrane protein
MLWPGMALALFWAVAPAQAALTLCNRTSTVLYAATAAIKGAQVTAQGWSRIVPGDCQVTRAEDLTADRYMVHARSSLAYGGPARAWGGNLPICVRDADFRLQQKGSVGMCKEDGAFALPFAALNTGGKKSWTMTLDESPALPSLVAAQLAGVKRLLHDNGYDVGPLDGAPSKKTGAALAAFRKQNNLDQAGNAELFDALERQALKSNAPMGYTICNNGKALLEVALAQTAKDKSGAKGWWTVPPASCAHAVTTALGESSYYLFARHKGGAPVVTGAEKFCIAPAAFETKARGNCAALGQTEAGFLPTQTKGVSGFVAHVGDKGLLPGGGGPRP